MLPWTKLWIKHVPTVTKCLSPQTRDRFVMSPHPPSQSSSPASAFDRAASTPNTPPSPQDVVPPRPLFSFEAVLNAASEVSIIATDPEGVIQVFNPGAEKLLGYPAAEMIGVATPAAFHLPSEVAARGEQLSRQLGYPVSGFEVFVALPKQVGSESREWTYIRKEGTQRIVNLSVTCVRDAQQKVTGYLGVAVDVTERRRAERELERLALVASRTDNAVIITDSQGYVEWVNDGFTRITGYSLEEMRGKKPGHVLQGPQTDPATVQQLRDCVRAGQSYDGEIYNYAKDGRGYWLGISISPVFDAERRLTGFVAVEMDITDRKAAEHELHRAKEAAEAANLAKSEFLANMSHEIRTPLTAILGFAQILDLRLSNASDRDCVQTISRNGEHLLAIINDILDLSKIEAGKLEMERVRCSLPALIDEVVQLLQVRAEEKHLELSVEIRSSVPEIVETDPTRLRQILFNLLGNAIKFTEEGHVQLVVESRDQPPERFLAFSIHDTGLGISAADQTRLFSPFTQADASMNRRHGGTGLGLAISRRLARMLGGEISVQSELGVGSVFTATIKRVCAEADGQEQGLPRKSISPPASPDLTGRPLESLHILCAEDGIDNQRLLSFFLTRAGGRVRMVADGQQAVEAWQQALDQDEPIDVILLDLQMPVLNGYDACRQLRQLGFQRPIIAITAHASAKHEARCREAGCDGFASKPIQESQLIRIIRDLAVGK